MGWAGIVPPGPGAGKTWGPIEAANKQMSPNKQMSLLKIICSNVGNLTLHWWY